MISMRYLYGHKKAAAGLLAGLLLLLLPLGAFAEETGKSVTVRIPVSCAGPNEEEVFQYELTPETTEYQTVESTTLSLRPGEAGEFVITYTYPGTYHYTAHQEKGGDPAITYDGTVYQIDVFVTEDEQGALRADVILYAQGSTEKKAALTFRNRVVAPLETPPPEDDPEKPMETPPEDSPEKPILGFLTIPQTGDGAPLGLWMALAVLAALGMTVLWTVHFRQKREDDTNE